MSKFESNPDIKKLDDTQLDISFEDDSKNLDVEKESVIDTGNNSEIDNIDTEDEKKPGYEYYERFNEYKKKETSSPPKKPKTQQEKDFAKRQAILRAMKKAEYKKTGYESYDPMDPNL